MRSSSWIKVFAMLWVFVCVFTAFARCTENDTAAGALTYISAGVLIVDAGASIANGIALGVGNPSRMNGYVGVISGTVSLGLVAASYAIGEDSDLKDDFAVVMGAAGAASIFLGVLNIIRAPDEAGEPGEARSLAVYPEIALERGHSCRLGLAASIRF